MMRSSVAMRRACSGRGALAAAASAAILAWLVPFPGIAQGTTASLTLDVGPTLLVGEASDFLDGGVGGRIGASVRPRSSRVAVLRGAVGYLPLDDVRDPFAGTLENTLVTVGVGAEVRPPWRVAQPYGGVWILGVGNRWDAGGSGTAPGPGGAAGSTGTEWALGWGGTVGLLIRLEDRLHLDVAGQITDPGRLEFLRFGSNEPTTSVLVSQDVAMLSLSAGLRIRLRGHTAISRTPM